MTVLSLTPIRFDVELPSQFRDILRTAPVSHRERPGWVFLVPQMVADSYLCTMARRQGQLAHEFIRGVMESGMRPTYGGVPIVVDDTVAEIALVLPHG